MKKIALLALALTLISTSVHANQIVLYNTGVNADGSLLSDGQIDSHYTISKVAYAAPDSSLYTSPNPFPAAGTPFLTNQSASVTSLWAWVANGPKSNWLTPTSYPGTSGNVYTYQTTFDLTGLDPATAKISGSWSCDDGGWLFLNGKLVAELPFGAMFAQLHGIQLGDAGSYFTFTPNHDFQLTSGFVAGINKLEFVVWDWGSGASGVRAEFSSATADPPLKQVKIDVRPGITSNIISLKATERVPFAILSAKGFNAVTEIDLATVTLGATGNEQSISYCDTTGTDVNLDGLPDIICNVLPQKTGLTPTSTKAIFKGKTISGVPLTGQNTVKVTL